MQEYTIISKQKRFSVEFQLKPKPSVKNQSEIKHIHNKSSMSLEIGRTSSISLKQMSSIEYSVEIYVEIRLFLLLEVNLVRGINNVPHDNEALDSRTIIMWSQHCDVEVGFSHR